MGCGASAPKLDPNAPTPSQFLSRLPKPDADANAEAPAINPSAGIPDRSYMAIANQDKRFGGIGETLYSEYAIYEAAGEPLVQGTQLTSCETVADKARIWLVKDVVGKLVHVMTVEGKRRGQAFIYSVDEGTGNPISMEEFSKKVFKTSADTGCNKEKDLRALIDKALGPSTKLFYKARAEVTGYTPQDGITNLKLIDKLQYQGNDKDGYEELGVTYKGEIQQFKTPRGTFGCMCFKRPNGDGNAVIFHGAKHGDQHVSVSGAVADPMLYVHAAVIKNKLTDTWRNGGS